MSTVAALSQPWDHRISNKRHRFRPDGPNPSPHARLARSLAHARCRLSLLHRHTVASCRCLALRPLRAPSSSHPRPPPAILTLAAPPGSCVRDFACRRAAPLAPHTRHGLFLAVVTLARPSGGRAVPSLTNASPLPVPFRCAASSSPLLLHIAPLPLLQ
ncbi:hypothetical protein DAI22_11g203045 [Oryza sativa Japonica Group]|nr:hypothetical protein DAI22_11g203045 [Oryza sativa Japonica Group]